MFPFVVHRQTLHIYRLFPHIAADANANLTCLWLTLAWLINNGKSAKDGTLYLQVDGASDNINNTLLKLASFLCQKHYFKRVVISRLPVGHTHEDVDQRFGVISRVGFLSLILCPCWWLGQDRKLIHSRVLRTAETQGH